MSDIPTSMPEPVEKVTSFTDLISTQADRIRILEAEAEVDASTIYALRVVIETNERKMGFLQARLDELEPASKELVDYDDPSYQPIDGVKLTPNQKRHLDGIPVDLTPEELGMTPEEHAAEQAEVAASLKAKG